MVKSEEFLLISLEEVEKGNVESFVSTKFENAPPTFRVSDTVDPRTPITIFHPSTALYSVDEICFTHERYSKTRKTVRESGIKTT